MRFPTQSYQGTAFLTCNHPPCAYGVQADDRPQVCCLHGDEVKPSLAVLTPVCSWCYAAKRQKNGRQFPSLILFKI